MLKLILPSLAIAPLMWLAASDVGDASVAPATVSKTASASGFAARICESETVGVSFHDALLTAHSADALGRALARVPEGCRITALRVTALVPENADAFHHAQADARQAELAAHMSALLGGDARDLAMRASTRTSRADERLRRHALLRIELREPSRES